MPKTTKRLRRIPNVDRNPARRQKPSQQPAALSPGEKLLRRFLACCAGGRIAASDDDARQVLVALLAAAGRLLDGDAPHAALGLPKASRGRPKAHLRDRDIALQIHSEKARRNRPWAVVTANINRWLSQQAENGPALSASDRRLYRVRLSQPRLRKIYQDHRALAEAWNLLLPDAAADKPRGKEQLK
jgi:hypothetical protein